MLNNEERIIKKLSKTIKIESFLKLILDDINFYLCDRSIELNIGRNYMTIKTNTNTINIAINSKNVLYTKESKDKKVIKEYKKIKQGYIVRIIDESKQVYDLGTTNSINKEKVKEIRFYDTNCKEVYRGIKIKVDNYYQDKKTKIIKLHDPDIMENYEEKEYYYRIEDKYIIERKIRKYIYPDGTEAFIKLKNSDNVYLRNELVNKDTKDIPIGGYYYEIDKNVFFDYNQKKINSDDIVDNFKRKKYCISDKILF